MTDQRFDDGRETEEFGSIQRNKEFENGQAETKKKSRNLFSTFWSKISRRSGSTDIDVTQYLDHNQDILEAYLMKSVSVNQLETWLDRKKLELDKTRPTDYNQSLLREGGTTKDFFMNFETKLKQSGNELSSILELIHFIASVVTIDAYRIFKIDHDDTNPVKLIVMDSPNMPTDFAEAGDDIVELVRDVANKQKCLRLSKEHDSAFTNTPSTLLNKFGCEKKREAKHLLYQPISTIGKTIYVIEMWRNRAKFEDRDEEICANIVVAFHYCNLYVVKQRECNMSEVFLDDLKAIFEDMVSLDRLINSISKLAQRLVNAERASLCLVDLNSSELNQEMIRYVASSGKTLHIPNAYSDREEDVATGFKTKSILCMPIKVRGKVIAVAEMVNKKNGLNFDHRDEVAFEKFSIIFGLALHNAKLYKNIKRNGKRYKVALEILSYHNTCKDHEVQEIKNDKRALPTLNDFYLDPYELDNLQKCKAAITMFDHLFDLSKFDSMAVTKFILTVKKNYRAVPYHNFDHGWSVAHAMYVMLINDHEQRFSYKMKLALFVACLCHDLDHRGYNNNYLNETASPLAAMYSSSPLEHHHFSITVIILQQDGHNIFSHLSSEDYKEVLEHIEHCILATDLAAFTPNLAKLKHSFGENSDHQSFDWEIPSNRNLAMALSMTAADLSASAKPWKIQIKTVEVIFEEFYFQGDKERDAGITPIPMMDRNKPQEKPASQVGFLNHICIPCYNMLYKIFPQTKPMYKMALENLRIWQT